MPTCFATIIRSDTLKGKVLADEFKENSIFLEFECCLNGNSFLFVSHAFISSRLVSFRLVLRFRV